MKQAKAMGWGRFAALIAGLAILFQASLVPPARAQTMELCTAHGTKTVLVADDAAPVMPGDCGHCGHCVLAAPADVPVSRLSLPVRYTVAAPVLTGADRAIRPQARAPPRPPGQGPPIL